MTGYTPMFDSVYGGTLAGKWPDLAVWMTILPLADRYGRIDMTPRAIAAQTGWPLEFLLLGIEGLCAPDPDSRSKSEDGRRLVLLDPSRNWGWQVVNHEKYREKARKSAFDAERTASGRDAERKRMSRDVPLSPATSRADPLSESDSDSEKKQRERAPKRATRAPKDFVPDLVYAAKACPGIDAAGEAQKFMDHEFAAPKSDWQAAWRNWVRRCHDSGKFAKEASKWM